MAQPFAGIRVLDLTHVLAGPFCAYQFALLGADVIKIEPPETPDCSRGRGPDPAQNSALRGLTYQVQGANKRAMAVDAKAAEGRAIILDLARSADVFLENYRPGVLDGLGLGYADVAAAKPAIVYCSLTGFGPEGPRGTLGAYDNVIQAASGLMAQSEGRKHGASFVDYISGYAAAFAISAALFRRAREGAGQHITCSMLETALVTMAPELAAQLYPVKTERAKEAGIQLYDTVDGKLMLAAFTSRQYNALGACLGRLGHALPALAAIATWDDVWRESDALRPVLAAIFKTRNTAAWVDALRAHNIPAEAVRPLSEAAADPHIAARGFLHRGRPHTGDTEPPSLPVAPYRMDHDGPAIERPPPGFAEHTDAVLTELGLSPERINDLKRRGIVR